MAVVNPLIKPTSGTVLIKGQKVSKSNRNIGYMFQKDQLLEWRNILQNVVLGLEIQGKLSSQHYEKAKNLLNNYGLGDFIYSYPS